MVEPLTARNVGQAVGLGGVCGADILGQQTEEDGRDLGAGDAAARLYVAVRVADDIRKVIVAVQTGRYVIRDVDSRLAAAATAGAAAAGAVGPYADELDVLPEVLKRGHNIAGAVNAPAAEGVAALRGGLRGRDRVAAAHFDLGRSRSSTCVGRNIARYFIGDIAEFAVRGLERERIGNGLFTDCIFVCVVIFVRRVTVPALVVGIRQHFRAVLIPADDRVFAVVQYPVFADRGKSDATIASVSFILIGTVVNIIASIQRMVVIQLCTSRNSNFAVVADASAILGFAAVVLDNRVGTDFNRTAVSDCRNCIVNQIYGCIICKLDICVSRLSGSYSQSADIVTLYDFIGYRIAGAGNCQRCTVLYVDITTVHEDTAVSVILYQQGSTIFHGKNICICITSNTHIVAADFRI